MKNGTVAGAVAGVIAGIVALLFLYMMTIMGIAQTIPGLTWGQWGTSQVGINIIIGAVAGYLYARFYDLIWGKGISKGIIWNMVIFFFADIVAGLWLGAMLMAPLAIAWVINAFIARLTNGIVLGAIYKK
jgi:hypothetical protein